MTPKFTPVSFVHFAGNIRFIINSALYVSVAVLPSCHGVFGTSKITTHAKNGLCIYQVESYGFEVRNIVTSRGISLGRISSTFAFPEREVLANTEDRWAISQMPASDPIWIARHTCGMSLNMDPVFMGVSLGISHANFAYLPTDKSTALIVTPRPNLESHNLTYQKFE